MLIDPVFSKASGASLQKSITLKKVNSGDTIAGNKSGRKGVLSWIQ
jgi:hypothetical protein